MWVFDITVLPEKSAKLAVDCHINTGQKVLENVLFTTRGLAVPSSRSPAALESEIRQLDITMDVLLLQITLQFAARKRKHHVIDETD